MIIDNLDFDDLHLELVPLPPAHVYGTWGNVLGVFFRKRSCTGRKTNFGWEGNRVNITDSSIEP